MSEPQGNAGRVARLAVPIRMVDLLHCEQVEEAVAGCDVIVNCALGDDVSMIRGLNHLLEAARRGRPQKLIHLSSISIYGEDPAPGSGTEAGRPDPGRNPYGVAKLRQDKMALRLQKAGVPVYLLCPGNITGPYSPFLRGLVERLMGGQYPSNLVHVDNLVEAILSAIRTAGGAGERYFVNETRPVSWRQLFQDLSGRLGIQCSFVDVSRKEVLPFLPSRRRTPGLREQCRIALSGEFRRALSILPVFARMNLLAASVFESLPPATQRRIRERLRWPVRVEKPDPRPSLDDRYVQVQVRRFYHSPQKLMDKLGWKPPLDYEQGLDGTASWVRFAALCERPRT
ncbi:MAG: NAD-dependent epimerase/dehydratase family protein [Acidobacteria bacterium]|nr:NAD-dependent epimerase/dehydratase family protein [Acidobacteriota bacterium]